MQDPGPAPQLCTSQSMRSWHATSCIQMMFWQQLVVSLSKALDSSLHPSKWTDLQRLERDLALFHQGVLKVVGGREWLSEI